MTAELLTKGTKTRSAPQIAQEIEALGGVINSSAGWDASRASVNVIASKTEPAMAILADVVRNPVVADAVAGRRLRGGSRHDESCGHRGGGGHEGAEAPHGA
jgi:zinc protease